MTKLKVPEQNIFLKFHFEKFSRKVVACSSFSEQRCEYSIAEKCFPSQRKNVEEKEYEDSNTYDEIFTVAL